MAGDWIKMRCGLADDPKVKLLADAWERSGGFAHDLTGGAESECYLSRNALRHLVTGALHSVWSLVNEHGQGGFVTGATLGWINDIVGAGDFAGAMLSVGWVAQSDGGLMFPKFERNNTCGAERQKRYRDRKKESVTSPVTSPVTSTERNALPLEKRREEKKRDTREGVPSCSEPEVPASKPTTDEGFAKHLPTAPCSGPVKEWRVPTAKLEEWREAYSTLDVDAEIRKAIQWIKDNPTKKKTAGGMPAYIGKWLGRATNSGFNGNGKPRDLTPAEHAERSISYMFDPVEKERIKREYRG